MSFLRFIGILITLAFSLTSCSPRISQIEYDRKNYEFEQLKVRYELLKKEVDSDIVSTPMTNQPQTEITSDISIADYEELNQNYTTLMQQYTALETAYNEAHKQQQLPKPINETTTSSGVDLADYEALKQKHQILMQEHSSLKIAYNELQEQPIVEVAEVTKPTDNISEISLTEHEELKQNYAALVQEHTTLKTAYNELQEEPKFVNPPGTVSKTAYTELQIEKTALEKRYTILENRYKNLEKVASKPTASSINSAEIIEPTTIDPSLNIGKGKELEENSIDLGTTVIQSASHNGLFFDFDTYDRTEEFLVLEIAVKNNSQNSLKTFWNADKIQIIDKYGNTYTSNSFRVGVDYANEVDNTLLKKIKDENTVFARFAFEELPNDLKQIQSLKFIVVIESEERAIEFTQIDISNIETE